MDFILKVLRMGQYDCFNILKEIIPEDICWIIASYFVQLCDRYETLGWTKASLTLCADNLWFASDGLFSVYRNGTWIYDSLESPSKNYVQVRSDAEFVYLLDNLNNAIDIYCGKTFKYRKTLFTCANPLSLAIGPTSLFVLNSKGLEVRTGNSISFHCLPGFLRVEFSFHSGQLLVMDKKRVCSVLCNCSNLQTIYCSTSELDGIYTNGHLLMIGGITLIIINLQTSEIEYELDNHFYWFYDGNDAGEPFWDCVQQGDFIYISCEFTSTLKMKWSLSSDFPQVKHCC